MVISNVMPSYFFWPLPTSGSIFVGTITARMRRPGANGPSNFMPNHVPNSVESANARQTRSRGARSRIFFSMRSVFISNLLVAHYHRRSRNATKLLRIVRTRRSRPSKQRQSFPGPATCTTNRDHANRHRFQRFFQPGQSLCIRGAKIFHRDHPTGEGACAPCSVVCVISPCLGKACEKTDVECGSFLDGWRLSRKAGSPDHPITRFLSGVCVCWKENFCSSSTFLNPTAIPQHPSLNSRHMR